MIDVLPQIVQIKEEEELRRMPLNASIPFAQFDLPFCLFFSSSRVRVRDKTSFSFPFFPGMVPLMTPLSSSHSPSFLWHLSLLLGDKKKVGGAPRSWRLPKATRPAIWREIERAATVGQSPLGKGKREQRPPHPPPLPVSCALMHDKCIRCLPYPSSNSPPRICGAGREGGPICLCSQLLLASVPWYQKG